MSIKVENLGNNTVKLEITVDSEVFEDGMQQSYKKNAKRFNIPGFRKGKAPRKIIESYYGEGVFYEDAINIVCSKAYADALESEDIHPVDEPEIDIEQIGSGKDLIFTAKVTVKPEVELGQYKGVELEKQQVHISEEDINQELENIREKNARIINIENRPIQDDDIAVIDFEGFIDDTPFEGGSAQDYELTIGSGQFIPGFEEQLIGANEGDTVDVTVNFPEDYQNEDFAGKEALFKVTVKGIKVKELPELDDEFAKDVSEFDTLEEFKEDIERKQKEEAEQKAKQDLENEAVKVVSQNAQIDVPEAMIEKQIESMEKDFNLRLRYQGLDLEKYLELTGSNLEDFRNSIRPQAVDQIKGRLTLEAIAKQENIDATEEEVEDEIKKLADNYNQNVEDFKQHLRAEDIEYIKEGAIINKTINFIIDNAQVTEVSNKEENSEDESSSESDETQETVKEDE